MAGSQTCRRARTFVRFVVSGLGVPMGRLAQRFGAGDGLPGGAGPSLGRMSGSWDAEERAALVALLRARPQGLSWPDLTTEVAAAGSAVAVWDRLVPQVLFGADVGQDPLEAARQDVATWSVQEYAFLTFMDEEYPARLRDVHQVPPVIFTRGELRIVDRGVSVVGSRSASADGLTFAADVARSLAERGLTTISGLAAGIDTSAHTAALAAGGRTVAVIGTGIRRSYPDQNRDLQQEIARRGLLLSQFWPDAPPTRFTFPMRNAVMSAYGHATIVVEAGEHSGARIQAREAVQHGRPVILTEGIVRATNWGRQMVGQPGVRVASDPVGAIELVEQVLDQDGEVENLLLHASS